jgi:flagellar L-ring protein FlgH
MKSRILVQILFFLALAAGCAAAQEVDNPYGDEDTLSKPRARFKHDRVTIVINWQISAKHEATTDISKESSAKWTWTNIFRIVKDRDGDFIPSPVADDRKPTLDVSSEREHTGEGETENTSTATAIVPGEVAEVLPNGHLVIVAHKTLKVNNEERTVTLTGRVDPKDLNANNEISDRHVMEMDVKITGKGDVSDAVRRGWLAKIFDKINPF